MSVRSGRRGAASRGGPGGGAEAWVPFRLCRTADVIRLATNTLQTLELIRILPQPLGDRVCEASDSGTASLGQMC